MAKHPSVDLRLSHDYHALEVKPVVLEPGESVSVDEIGQQAVHYTDDLPDGENADDGFGPAFFNEKRLDDILELSDDGKTVTLSEDFDPADRGGNGYPMIDATGINVSRTYLEGEPWNIDGALIITVCKHEWDEGTVTKAATCTEEGILTKTCRNRCGETKEEPVDATGHSLKHVAATDTTVEYWECETCKKYFSDAEGKKEMTAAELAAANRAKADAKKAADDEKQKAAQKAAEDAKKAEADRATAKTTAQTAATTAGTAADAAKAGPTAANIQAAQAAVTDAENALKAAKDKGADVTAAQATLDAAKASLEAAKNTTITFGNKKVKAKKTIKVKKGKKLDPKAKSSTGAKLTFTSSNKKVATVTAKGVVKVKKTAKKGKTAKITVKCGDVSVWFKVKVK